MATFKKPRIVVSRCLGFDSCRWNGEKIRDEFVERLGAFVEFQTVCPEVEIGLGVPREPVRVVKSGDELLLMQPATGGDFTHAMRSFCEGAIGAMKGVDGFLLKSRSPSCGMKDVKLYPGIGKDPVIGKTSGFFGAAVLMRFPELPVEDEARLGDWRIRDHFLTRIFMQAELREAIASGAMSGLVEFQSRHKLILMAASQVRMRAMGKLVANHARRPLAEISAEYAQELGRALAKPPKSGCVINSLMHAFGYVSGELKPAERRFFLQSLERYRLGRIPMGVPLGIMREFAVRCESSYLLGQSLFEPYPEELMLVTDSGKGRSAR